MNIINIAKAAIVECGGPGQPVCNYAELLKTAANLFKFALEFAFVMAALSIAWGGIRLLTAGASEEGISVGRSALKGAFIGLAWILGAWILINTMISFFTDCTNWHIIGGIICA